MTAPRIGGWWRIWIVGSVLYGAVVALTSWPDAPRADTIMWDDSQLTRVSDRTLDILAGKVQPAFAADAPEWARAPRVLELPNGQTLNVPGNTTDEQIQEVTKDLARVRKSIANERHNGALRRILILWIAPCAIALILGWSITWIRRGFKRTD
jgi:hypothetical protein